MSRMRSNAFTTAHVRMYQVCTTVYIPTMINSLLSYIVGVSEPSFYKSLRLDRGSSRPLTGMWHVGCSQALKAECLRAGN